MRAMLGRWGWRQTRPRERRVAPTASTQGPTVDLHEKYTTNSIEYTSATCHAQKWDRICHECSECQTNRRSLIGPAA